jgi:hypothetical protein
MATSALGGALPAANTALPSISRRSLVSGLAIAPLAACAAPAVATIPAEWTALLTEKDKALAAFDLAFDAHSDAQQRYYDKRPEEPKAIVKANAVDENGVIFFDAEEFRADWAAAKEAFAKADDAAMTASGWAMTEEAQRQASDVHDDVMRRILAFATVNPTLIAEKLELCVREYGDESGGIALIMHSLKGDVA